MTSIKRSILGLSLLFMLGVCPLNSHAVMNDTSYLSSKMPQYKNVSDTAAIGKIVKHIKIDEEKKDVTVKELTEDYQPILDRAYGFKKRFLMKAIPLAIQVHEKYGIPASSILAMACFESNYGQSELSEGAHNYFGIKALRDWSGDVCWSVTKDCGHRHRQPFRQYDSMAESFKDYAMFLKQERRYASAFATSNGKEFVRRVLAAGYCPDPTYLDFISEIMLRYNLESLDSRRL